MSEIKRYQSNESAPEFVSPGEQVGEVSVILPMGCEIGYCYPLVIWLCADSRERAEVVQVFPSISRRNYIGMAIEFPDEWLIARDDIAFEDWLNSQIKVLPIHRRRIYLAGRGFLGEHASEVASTIPVPIAGMISLLSDTVNKASLAKNKRHFWLPSEKGRETMIESEIPTAQLSVSQTNDLSPGSPLWREIDSFIMRGIYSSCH